MIECTHSEEFSCGVCIGKSKEEILEKQINDLKEERNELMAHIQHKKKAIKADHAISTGYHKRYLTGQYDAYDNIYEKIKCQNSE